MKKIVSALTVLLLAGSLFAQVSNLKGILNAQSDFIDVNEWETVNPEHLFATASFGSTSYLNAGLAKKFGEFYTAVSYDGRLWSNYSGNSVKTTNTEKSTWSKTNSYTFTTSDSQSVKFLFGTGSLGISPYFTYSPTGTNTTTVTTNESNTKTGTVEQNGTYSYGVNAGYNFDTFNGWFGFGGDTYLDKTTTQTTAINSTTDASYTNINFNIGGSFSKVKTLTHTFSGDFTFTSTIYPKYSSSTTTNIAGTSNTTTTENKGAKNNTFGFNPEYKAEINPVENLYLSAAVYGYLNFNFNSTSSTATGFNLQFNPYVRVNLNYAVKPQFVISLGWLNIIPSMNLTTSKDTASSTAVKNSSNFITGAYSSYLYSSFAWFINQNTALNCSLDIFGTSNTTSFWSMINNSFTISCALQF